MLNLITVTLNPSLLYVAENHLQTLTVYERIIDYTQWKYIEYAVTKAMVMQLQAAADEIVIQKDDKFITQNKCICNAIMPHHGLSA